MTVTSRNERSYTGSRFLASTEVDPETIADRYASTGLHATQLRRLQDQLDRLPMPRPPAAYDCW